MFRSTTHGQNRRRRATRGQGVAEYAFILAVLGLILVGIVGNLSSKVRTAAANAQSGLSYTGGAGSGLGAPAGGIYCGQSMTLYDIYTCAGSATGSGGSTGDSGPATSD